jgi:hypothetical protein
VIAPAARAVWPLADHVLGHVVLGHVDHPPAGGDADGCQLVIDPASRSPAGPAEAVVGLRAELATYTAGDSTSRANLCQVDARYG